jgi:hypothetical protein
MSIRQEQETFGEDCLQDSKRGWRAPAVNQKQIKPLTPQLVDSIKYNVTSTFPAINVAWTN